MNLQGLEDILKRITPGPWKMDFGAPEGFKNDSIAVQQAGEMIWPAEFCHSMDDAQFIVTARNVMPELLALVRAWDARQEHFKSIENGELCKDQYAWDLGDKLWADIEKARDEFIDKLESEEA